VGLGRNYEERSRSAPVVAEGERRVATRQAPGYLGEALLYLDRCFAVAAHVMVDDKALASQQVRRQFIEIDVLGAPFVVALRARLKTVIGVDEYDVAASDCGQGALQPPGSMPEPCLACSGSDVRHASEGERFFKEDRADRQDASRTNAQHSPLFAVDNPPEGIV